MFTIGKKRRDRATASALEAVLSTQVRVNSFLQQAKEMGAKVTLSADFLTAKEKLDELSVVVGQYQTSDPKDSDVAQEIQNKFNEIKPILAEENLESHISLG